MRSKVLAATVLTGVAAGIGGVLLTLLLHGVQHLAFGYTENTFLIGVERASALRRVLALAIGGAVVGTGWWLLRRVAPAPASVTHALQTAEPELPIIATTADAAVQIVAVGVGGSLGREGAPRQVGAALGSWIGARFGLAVPDRRTLLACGAGAGLAAVYNVPFGGALFSLEVLLASVAIGDVVSAVVTSGIATVVAWPVLGTAPTYDIHGPGLSVAVVGWSIVAGPVAGIAGLGFVRLTTYARTHAPTGWRSAAAITVVFALLGGLAIHYPQLPGNGKGLAQLAFTGSLGLGLAAVLSVLKPITTAACLGSGAIGGLLTPSLATGGALGAMTGELWTHVWSGGSPTAYALVGAAALMGATQRAPLTAIVLVLEFTHTGAALLVPMVIAVAAATITYRLADRSRRVPTPPPPLRR